MVFIWSWGWGGQYAYKNYKEENKLSLKSSHGSSQVQKRFSFNQNEFSACMFSNIGFVAGPGALYGGFSVGRTWVISDQYSDSNPKIDFSKDSDFKAISTFKHNLVYGFGSGYRYVLSSNSSLRLDYMFYIAPIKTDGEKVIDEPNKLELEVKPSKTTNYTYHQVSIGYNYKF